MRLAPLIAIGVLTSATGAHAQVVIETVTVGNPGNPGTADDFGNGYGGVSYVYSIGKYEITAGQYTEFLNAVAEEDTYGLYNSRMWSVEWGCKIERIGSSPNYRYSVAPDWADRPVNYVSWGDAARICNWLQNGQPTGAQNLTTTEDGSYYLNGAMEVEHLMAVVREPGATWVIPSENEWYKSAYHYNDGVTAHYYDYATSNDSVPSNDLVEPDPGNNATFYRSGYTIGSPYYRTVAGDFENSASPYDTFDQTGNVHEWTEAVNGSRSRNARGGSFLSDRISMRTRPPFVPSYEIFTVGFRVAYVPPLCGDGAVHNSDQCDDANAHDGDGCSSSCTVEDGWECTGEPSICTEICGDGIIVGLEKCDGGLSCTGCLCDAGFEPTVPPSPDCQPTCGNGSVDPGEECDGGTGCTDCVCDSGFEPTSPPFLDCKLEPSDNIPAVSTWGLGILALVLLVGAKVYYNRRHAMEV